MAYNCKKCGEEFEELNKFKGHNLKCKVKEEVKNRLRDGETRIPLGVARRKLSYDNQDPNFSYRVIHNRPGRPNRVNEAIKAGYDFVEGNEFMGDPDVSNEMTSSTDSRITHVVGEGDNGKPLIGYLMRIPMEFYKEDQAEKMKRIDETEKAILRGIDAQGKPGAGGRYLPTDASGAPITRIER